MHIDASTLGIAAVGAITAHAADAAVAAMSSLGAASGVVIAAAAAALSSRAANPALASYRLVAAHGGLIQNKNSAVEIDAPALAVAGSRTVSAI